MDRRIVQRIVQRSVLFLLPLVLCVAAGCQKANVRPGGESSLADRKIRAVATTSMIADLVTHVGGSRVAVEGLMGPGVDPHLYKASEGDVTRMAGADVIFYSGLHLEGKMTDLFEQMRGRGIITVAVAEGGIDESQRIVSPNFAGNYDPHVWFDVTLWMEVARHVEQHLSEMDPEHAALYQSHAVAYLRDLQDLDTYVKLRSGEIPSAQRVLVTAHDAFNYFGRAYGFEVRGLQGISTATEAGTADIQGLADFIVSRRIPAIFVESSVSPRSIEAVTAAVRARDFDVKIGGNLYSDALGNPGTPEGTYIGTVRHNIDTIVDAILGVDHVAVQTGTAFETKR